jgi:hypothetical protein
VADVDMGFNAIFVLEFFSSTIEAPFPLEQQREPPT